MKTRPSATAGPEYPELTGARHLTVSSSGSSSTIPVSVHTPTRPAPRHCGQSSALNPTPQPRATQILTVTNRPLMVLFSSESETDPGVLSRPGQSVLSLADAGDNDLWVANY